MFPARSCAANRRGAIAGRLLEDGTTVVVIEKDQEALGLGPLSGWAADLPVSPRSEVADLAGKAL